MKHSKNWKEHSRLCQNLLNPEYRKLYVNFAKLNVNTKNRRNMLRIADQAEKISMVR